MNPPTPSYTSHRLHTSLPTPPPGLCLLILMDLRLSQRRTFRFSNTVEQSALVEVHLHALFVHHTYIFFVMRLVTD